MVMNTIEAERRFAARTDRTVILRSLLKSFCSWLQAEGHAVRDSSDMWGTQVKQVQVGDHWMAIWNNKSFREHYVLDKRLQPLLLHFLAELRPPVASAAE